MVRGLLSFIAHHILCASLHFILLPDWAFITLCNSIDREATRRFGQKWWDNPVLHCRNRKQGTNFYNKITQDIGKLNSDWQQEQRLKGIRNPGPLPGRMIRSLPPPISALGISF